MGTDQFAAPVLVTRPAGLEKAVERLSRERILAVDTESNSLYAYREQVCLIQFSTTKEDYLVDPLALEDLTALGPLFADPGIEKVFHAAEYDVITMKRDFGFTFDNLFDTMVAARILGWEEVGLGAMLRAEFGVQLDKRLQRANWGQRPLTLEMLSYARLDTHYLIDLRERMKAELLARDRWDLAVEDFRRLRQVNGRVPEELPEACWRISGSYDLDGQQAAVLQELCRYRDTVARAINRPLFKVFSDQSLLAIAATAPADLKELRRLNSLNPRQLQRHGEALVRSVRRGLKAEPIYPPRSPRPDEAFLARLDALKTWRKATGQKLGVNSDIVLPRDLLYALAAARPDSREGVARIMRDVPWRLGMFGESIYNLLSKY
jgi:ribonuclease D